MDNQRKTVSALRLDAQLAYLDGRVKRAKALNKQADILVAVEHGAAPAKPELWFPALKTVTAAVYEGPPTRTGSGCIGGGFPLPR